MSLSDPIGDMISRIKNAQMRNHKKVQLPKGPSIFKILPFRITLTFSGIGIFILPIFDINKPYKLFLHLLFVFWHLYQS